MRRHLEYEITDEGWMCRLRAPCHQDPSADEARDEPVFDDQFEIEINEDYCTLAIVVSDPETALSYRRTSDGALRFVSLRSGQRDDVTKQECKNEREEEEAGTVVKVEDVEDADWPMFIEETDGRPRLKKEEETADERVERAQLRTRRGADLEANGIGEAWAGRFFPKNLTGRELVFPGCYDISVGSSAIGALTIEDDPATSTRITHLLVDLMQRDKLIKLSPSGISGRLTDVIDLVAGFCRHFSPDGEGDFVFSGVQLEADLDNALGPLTPPPTESRADRHEYESDVLTDEGHHTLGYTFSWMPSRGDWRNAYKMIRHPDDRRMAFQACISNIQKRFPA